MNRRTREYDMANDRYIERETMEVFLHHETDAAILVSEFGINQNAVWLPKSQTFHRVIKRRAERDEKGRSIDIVEIEAPDWLLQEKGLI